MDDPDDCWQNVNAALTQIGLPARPEDRAAIIAALEKQVQLEADEVGDQFLMRLLCALLFTLGKVEDSLLIWRAKECNFDTHPGIDVTFLCGAGLEQTKSFLEASGTEESKAAWEYIRNCEGCGNFATCSVANELTVLKRY